MQMYEYGDHKRRKIGIRAKKYIKNSFTYKEMIKKWDISIEDTTKNWKNRYERIRIEEIK